MKHIGVVRITRGYPGEEIAPCGQFLRGGEDAGVDIIGTRVYPSDEENPGCCDISRDGAVGAVGIEKYATSQKPRKQRRCSRSYRDNHYKHYKAERPLH